MYTRFEPWPKAAGEPPLLLPVLAVVVLNLLWRTVRYALGFPLFGDEAFVANSFMVRDMIGLRASADTLPQPRSSTRRKFGWPVPAVSPPSTTSP